MTANENAEREGLGVAFRGLIDRWGAVLVRAAGFAVLLGAEVIALLELYAPAALPQAAGAQDWMRVHDLIKGAALSVLSAPTAIAFCILTWTKLGALAAALREHVQGHAWGPWLAANAAVFALTCAATLALNAQVANAGAAPWAALALWCAGAAAIFPTAALVLAPARYWMQFVRAHAVSIILAIAAGALVSQLSSISQGLWDGLAGWTLRASAWILALYEPAVSFDAAAHTITVGDFSVYIHRSCSGYEGMGLVGGFLGVFLWAFRADLRFPNALLILPIGVAAIWCLNALRVAVLITLGAHVSPELAVTSFHSQAGWLMFLVVSISLMFATYRIGFFRAGAREAPRALDPGVREACAYLLPFIALLAAGILARAFTLEGEPLYPLCAAAACAAMWPFRDIYLRLIARPQIVSVLAGLVVGAGWIATDPAAGAPSALGLWLDSLPAWLAASWICVRVVGASVLVPIAEELAFRGYLHRALISRRFESVADGKFTWAAFVVSTALFALMHERWLAAAIAGAIYALVMYRTNRLSDAVVAHACSNALIAAWAVLWGQWSLL